MYLEGIIALIITKNILNYNKNINQIDNVINYYLDNIDNIENAEKVLITFLQIVLLSIIEEKTLEREIRPFILIKDNFPKVLVTNETINLSLPDGVKHLKLIDFLMETSNSNKY